MALRAAATRESDSDLLAMSIISLVCAFSGITDPPLGDLLKANFILDAREGLLLIIRGDDDGTVKLGETFL